MMHRSNVLLPPPLGPIMNRRSCRPISRSRPLKTWTAPCPKLLYRPLIRMKLSSCINLASPARWLLGERIRCTALPLDERRLLAAADDLVHVEFAELRHVAFGNGLFQKDVQGLDL